MLWILLVISGIPWIKKGEQEKSGDLTKDYVNWTKWVRKTKDNDKSPMPRKHWGHLNTEIHALEGLAPSLAFNFCPGKKKMNFWTKGMYFTLQNHYINRLSLLAYDKIIIITNKNYWKLWWREELNCQQVVQKHEQFGLPHVKPYTLSWILPPDFFSRIFFPPEKQFHEMHYKWKVPAVG